MRGAVIGGARRPRHMSKLDDIIARDSHVIEKAYALSQPASDRRYLLDLVKEAVPLLTEWQRLYPDLKPQTLSALNAFNEVYLATGPFLKKVKA